MLYLITGGSGSGKSEYAEELLGRLCEAAASKAEKRKIYIATMIPRGRETKEKIKRHREMRREKHFETVECYKDLENVTEHELFAGDSQERFVLLECMSNLAANEMFEREEQRPDSAKNVSVAEKILQGVRLLEEKCRAVVIVTNEVCSESAADSPEMCLYKKNLSEINCRLAALSEAAAEVVYGIPCFLKSGGNSWKRRLPTGEKTEVFGKDERKEGLRMELIIGGAYQGKLSYAKKRYPNIAEWSDGAICPQKALLSCKGMYHFEEYIKRMMAEEFSEEPFTEKTEQSEMICTNTGQMILEQRMMSMLKQNPEIVLICREVGYGLVPTDAFERTYRETVGRLCTRIAAEASRVERVVCGIGQKIKE